ncbi:hypothetical protein CHS0354_013717, partial [Potamilus streckersoni]
MCSNGIYAEFESTNQSRTKLQLDETATLARVAFGVLNTNRDTANLPEGKQQPEFGTMV